MQLNVLSNSTCIEGSPYWQFVCSVGGTSHVQWRGDIPGIVINISCSNSPSYYTTEAGVQIQTSRTDTGCISTLSLSAEILLAGRTVNLTCQNIQLKTEDSISKTYTHWALEGGIFILCEILRQCQIYTSNNVTICHNVIKSRSFRVIKLS